MEDVLLEHVACKEDARVLETKQEGNMSSKLFQRGNIRLVLVTGSNKQEFVRVHGELCQDMESRHNMYGEWATVDESPDASTYNCESYLIYFHDEAVGVVSLTINRPHRYADVTLGILPDYQGRGIAVYAGAIMLNYVFDVLCFNRVNSACFGYNEASLKIQSLALRQEGVRRKFLFHRGRFWDHYLFGLLKMEYLELKEKYPRFLKYTN